MPDSSPAGGTTTTRRGRAATTRSPIKGAITWSRSGPTGPPSPLPWTASSASVRIPAAAGAPAGCAGSHMINTLEHPLVADYLRELDTALAGLPAAVAAELSEQIRAHLPAAGQGQAEAAGA